MIKRTSKVKMLRIPYLMAILVVVLVGCKSADVEPKTDGADDAAVKEFSEFSVKSSQSTVSIELKPYKVENGILAVDISVNTHSIDLPQFDLKELVTLEADGDFIKPISAPQLSGHHTSGQLVFPVKENIYKFKIIIKNIPDMPERILEWP